MRAATNNEDLTDERAGEALLALAARGRLRWRSGAPT